MDCFASRNPLVCPGAVIQIVTSFDFLCRSGFPKHQTLYERRNGDDPVTPHLRSCNSFRRQAEALLGKEY